jgi:hypothetical protein
VDEPLPITDGPAPPITDSPSTSVAHSPVPIGGGFARQPVKWAWPVIEMIPVAPFRDATPVAELEEQAPPEPLPKDPTQQEPEAPEGDEHDSMDEEGNLPLFSPQMYASIQWACELDDFDDDAPAEPGWNDVEDEGDF